MAPNTVRKRVSDAKQFFHDAVDRELLAKNPFSGLKGSFGGNRDRDYFVSQEAAAKVIEACPDGEWHLIFALARFGGLRVPSELLELRWSDVNWERGRILVPSPKTEHHEGGEDREIPIFPELRPHLEALWFDPDTDRAEFAINRYRQPNANLRTQLQRIIKRAGLTPWPKLFQNLRSTRETELAERFPLHVVCAWIGNSQAVARKHYLQVTDEHFESGLVALQNPVQTGAESSGTAQKSQGDGNLEHNETIENSRSIPLSSVSLPSQVFTGMGDTGLELRSATSCSDKQLRQLPDSRAANSGAFSGNSHSETPSEASTGTDPCLDLIIDRWPSLSENVRAAIARIVSQGSP